MKLSKKDIKDFLKKTEEKPILYKDGKRYTPTSKGYKIEKINKKRHS